MHREPLNQVFGPDRAAFAEWCDDNNRQPDRAALRDFMGETHPVRPTAVTTLRYPVTGHATRPRRCCRCAARVFDYAFEVDIVDGVIVGSRYYCPPCDRVRSSR